MDYKERHYLMQDPQGFIGKFGFLPEEFAQVVFVQFVGGSKEDLRGDNTLHTCISNLEQSCFIDAYLLLRLFGSSLSWYTR